MRSRGSHRNALTEKAWEDAVRVLGNGLVKSSTLLQAFSHHQLGQQETKKLKTLQIQALVCP